MAMTSEERADQVCEDYKREGYSHKDHWRPLLHRIVKAAIDAAVTEAKCDGVNCECKRIECEDIKNWLAANGYRVDFTAINRGEHRKRRYVTVEYAPPDDIKGVYPNLYMIFDTQCERGVPICASRGVSEDWKIVKSECDRLNASPTCGGGK